MQCKLFAMWLILLSFPLPGLSQDQNRADLPSERGGLYAKSAAVFAAVDRLRKTDPEAALAQLSGLEAALGPSNVAAGGENSLAPDIRSAIATARTEIGRYWPSPAEIERRLASNPSDVAALAGYALKLAVEVERDRPTHPRDPVEKVLAHRYQARAALARGKEALTAAQRATANEQARAALQREERWVARQLAEIERETTAILRDGREFPNLPLSIDELIDKHLLVEQTLADRLQRALERARLSDTHVLIIATNVRSPLSRELVAMLNGSSTPEFEFPRPLLLKIWNQQGKFRTIWADTSPGKPLDAARALFEKLKTPLPTEEAAAFVVVDAQGSLVAAKSSAELQRAEKFDAFQLSEFLQKHERNLEAQDAEELFASALAKAERDGKRVLLQLGGPGCAPCIELTRYLEQNQALLTRDYVLLKVDGRMVNIKKVMTNLRENSNSIPWMAILDSKGKPLATSTGPQGNIGFPNHPAGIDHFEKMLRTTMRNLREDDLQALLASLEASAR